MKKWFLLYMRFDASIDAYCASLSGNMQMLTYARNKINEIDRELDLIRIGELT